jgi:hypothetical protein
LYSCRIPGRGWRGETSTQKYLWLDTSF